MRAEEVARLGEDFRKTITVLTQGKGVAWTEEHCPGVWKEVVRLLDIYAEKARAVGIEPALKLED